jgi:adenine-specific DNA-methyltransferase
MLITSNEMQEASVPPLRKGQLVRLALALGAERYGGPLSRAEAELVDDNAKYCLHRNLNLTVVRNALLHGEDLLGNVWLASVPRRRRTSIGMVYTPKHIVRAMVRWVARRDPLRIIDMGCGSGRFTLEALLQHPRARLIAVDTDPVATMILRARLAVMHCTRARVLNVDYLDLKFDRVKGVTAFVGNPPYVRYHALSRRQRGKAVGLSRTLGYALNGLSGLHTHFLLATAGNATGGDIGCVITSAEWMQTRYGRPIRRLLAERLGLEMLHLLHAKAMAFPGIEVTPVIVGFRMGTPRKTVVVTSHATPATLGRRNSDAVRLPRERFLQDRWDFALHLNGASSKSEETGAPLGQLCRVHRGIATGNNSFFVMTQAKARQLGVKRWVRPVLTSAREVAGAKGAVRFGDDTKVLLCSPRNLKGTDARLAGLRAYLQKGRRDGVRLRYLCQHRHPWWYLGEPQPAPIVVTYMGRRPPVFALNPDRLLTLNVLHGLYPVMHLHRGTLIRLVHHLNLHSAHFKARGRVYQGGFWKYEPRELEAATIPVFRVSDLDRSD